MRRPSMQQKSSALTAAAGPELSTVMHESLIMDLDTADKTDALNQMVDLLAQSPNVKDPEALRAAIFEREEQLSTGIGIGLAVPHVRLASVEGFVIAVGRSIQGIEFDALDGQPVHIITMIAVSEKQSREYLKLLASLVTRLKDEGARRKIMQATQPEEIKSVFATKGRGV